MNFLSNAVDLKQSVECALKVYRRSLTTVLDEVYYKVNLCSFPLPLVPQVSHLPSPRQINYKAPPLFYWPLFFEGISTPKLESTTQQTVLMTIPLSFKIRALSLSPECLLNFLWNIYIPPYVGKIFKFMEYWFEVFLLMTLLTQNSPQVFVITPLTEGNYSFPQAAFFWKTVSPNSKSGWRKLWFVL